ncbi:hypothetical protein PSEUBRA_000979 [Kalmanozyma brasiliensis GHG001]|uniref:Uncharacterized protein n=1 Tax=Kalmanozyma brasiliensis (strain GHG001) TaxID=1365824 RepID=V5F202_KALBG|nr:uncharacterized protein PSEUBRA_000979 [Kalmanozyma brasiliensis GHG001]EST09384.1 hypothetical protein PSEUBRA_000979 [Kalmanozyma brasiliensis GHG001]
MEPALPLPLRLDVSHASVPTEHAAVSDAISHFLTSYAARTGTCNAASSSADDTATGSTGGVVAAQLTRLMNGLAGKIDYDAFTLLTSSAAVVAEDDDEPMNEEEETPAEVLDSNPPDGDTGDGIGTESFSKAQEVVDGSTPNIDSSLRSDPMDESPRKKDKKDKKDKKERKERKEKKLKKESTA